MLTTELCARLCADFPLQLPDAPACFACTRVVLDPWDDAEGGTVFIGEGTVDRPDRFYLLCAPGAPQHPNAAHYADPTPCTFQFTVFQHPGIHNHQLVSAACRQYKRGLSV